MDSHADTCLAGSNFIAYELTGETLSVYGFDDDAPPLQNIPIATCMTAHTLPDGEVIILVVHQALYFGKKHIGSLLCPNQIRCNGVRVDDCPKHLGLGLNTRHSVISEEDDISIPLCMDGIMNNFETHLPTKREINI